DFAQAFSDPTGKLYHLVQPTPGGYEIREFQIGFDDRPYGLFLKGFGEGEDGEIYACGSVALAPFGDTGVVQRIVVINIDGDANNDGVVDVRDLGGLLANFGTADGATRSQGDLDGDGDVDAD